MRNKILEKIKLDIMKMFQGAYGQADIAEDERSALITTHDNRGNHLIVKIEDNPEYQKQKR